MENKIHPSRRKVLLGGLALGAVASTVFLKPGDHGKNHSGYFKSLSNALNKVELARPTLVIDKQILLQNIKELSGFINQQYDYRIVGKSLPSLPLIELVMDKAKTNRLMMFHEPFLSQVALAVPKSDVLMGKPMPVVAAMNFYNTMANHSRARGGFEVEHQLQWLIDTQERLIQYRDLAKQLNVKMNINIELDVGLHRGGVEDTQQLHDMLRLIQNEPLLTFSGLMGYEPHVAAVPGDKIAHRDAAMKIYREQLLMAQQVMASDLSHLTLNAAGSPTYRYYSKDKANADEDFPHNELSAGSCLVKPLDFDLAILKDHQAACFIATPVVKTMNQTQLPGVDGLGKMMSMWDQNRERAFFTYGGYWKSQAVSPEGLSLNPIFGRSTNQEMYNGSATIDLRPDDWLFLRPTQSEFVFLQFGDIAVYDNGEITAFWPVFNAAA
jgi:D-serine deaminase-like pyridoxal phosphate-dependent protein